MQHHAPTGVRRHRRPRVLTLVTLGVVVSGSVAMASSASAVPAAQNRFVSASAPLAQAVTTTQIPSHNAFAAAARAARRASLAAAPRITTASLWSDKNSVHSGGTVQLTGQVSYGSANRVRAQVMKLQVKSGAAWIDVATRSASTNGYVVFAVKPTKSTSYRLAYAGVPALAGSASAAKTLTVTAGSQTTTVAGSTSAPAVAASGRGGRVLAAAAAQTGKPYVYGAAGPSAFDCSGLTLYAYKTVGITLPHNADAQKGYGKAVSQAAALPGDLIIFLSGGYGYHAAIYAGGGYMYDAPTPGSTVGKHKIYSGTVIFRRLV